MASLAKEVCFYLSKTASLRGISSHLLKALETLLTQAECPFTFIDSESVSPVYTDITIHYECHR